MSEKSRNLVCNKNLHFVSSKIIDQFKNKSITMEKNPKALSDLQAIILSSAVNMVKMIDTYTELKRKETGIPYNNLTAARGDAIGVAQAAAAEVTNPDDATFTEEDSEKAEKLLETLGIDTTSVPDL